MILNEDLKTQRRLISIEELNEFLEGSKEISFEFVQKPVKNGL